MRTKRKPPTTPPVPEKIVFDTFRALGAWERSNLEHREPSCFNGCVAVRKWRITIEPLDEPREEVCARLQRLWEESDNHHHWNPLKAEAATLGYELAGDFGAKRRKRTP